MKSLTPFRRPRPQTVGSIFRNSPNPPARRPIIAIDGPNGVGKSTVAQRVADSLGYTLINSGSVFRSIAWVARQRGILPQGFRIPSRENTRLKNGEFDAALAQITTEVSGHLSLRRQGAKSQVFWGHRQITEEIRTESNGLATSSVATRPVVRQGLLDILRNWGRQGGIVMEGRDIGTVVFPDAEVKIFLTADPKVRAQRRFQELKRKGKRPDFETVLIEMELRDEQDQSRTVAPLQRAEDAELVDSSRLSPNDVLARILRIHAEKTDDGSKE